MLAQIVTENGQKKIKPLTADVGAGLPVGTWCSFENDVAPNANWIRAGTTFDASAYPVLASYLGTNVVPQRYDHSRLGDLEDVTISRDTNNPTIMEYDGIILSSGNAEPSYYINGIKVAELHWGNNSNVYQATTLSVKKGDSVCITINNSFTKARWYTHPLFIKATSGLSENQQDSVINALNVSRSYSTEETLTGKTWIDGKPIYRKAYQGSLANNTVIVSANVDKLVSCGGHFKGSGNELNPIPFGVSSGYLYPTVSTSNTIKISTTLNYSGEIWVEYTKTTD